MKMTHVTYVVSDVARAQAFLSDVLGLEVTADEKTVTGERFLTMGARSFGVELQIVESQTGETPNEADINPGLTAPGKQAGVVSFILQPVNLQKFMGQVERAGLKIHRQPTSTPYGLTAIFEDPFGYLWDAVERPEPSSLA